MTQHRYLRPQPFISLGGWLHVAHSCIHLAPDQNPHNARARCAMDHNWVDRNPANRVLAARLAPPDALVLHKAPQRVDAWLLAGAELLPRLVHLLRPRKAL